MKVQLKIVYKLIVKCENNKLHSLGTTKICSVFLIVTALKKVGVIASFRNIYYEMIENRTIAASSK